MNFITAIQHATIGYGVRRKGWRDGVCLTVDNFGCMNWVGKKLDPQRMGQFSDGDHCELLGNDPTYDLSAEDIKAKDWETV